MEFIDVQQGEIHVDEKTEIIQTLIKDYVRHLHECAQALNKVTNA